MDAHLFRCLLALPFRGGRLLLALGQSLAEMRRTHSRGRPDAWSAQPFGYRLSWTGTKIGADRHDHALPSGRVRDVEAQAFFNLRGRISASSSSRALSEDHGANDGSADLCHSNRRHGLSPTHFADHRFDAAYPAPPIPNAPLCLRLARRYTGAHLRAAEIVITELRADLTTPSIEIAESVGRAFGLWSFPDQDDVDFALPLYDKSIYQGWIDHFSRPTW